jgi:F-type H+-transporting ATPase subunit delta
MSDLLLNTILVMNGKNRAALIPLFCERFRRALARRHNELEVNVTTAHPLTPELRKRLTEVLARQTGRLPRLVERVDPDLVAGLTVQIEDQLLDDSAASHLRRMRETLLDRASRELQGGATAVVQE